MQALRRQLWTQTRLVQRQAAPFRAGIPLVRARHISIWGSEQAKAEAKTEATAESTAEAKKGEVKKDSEDNVKKENVKKDTEDNVKKEEKTGATAALSAEIAKLRSDLKEKDVQLAKVSRLYKSALADAENVRSRARDEVETTKQYAIAKFAKDLLEIADVLHIALDSVPEEHRSDSSVKELRDLYVGVSMTRDNLMKTLQRFGIEQFSPLNEEFDPNMHQALFHQPIPGKKSGTVFDVAKSGYRIGDRCLRPAQVGIVKHPEDN